MTLHATAELMKKGSVASAIGLGGIIVLVIFFRIGVVIKDMIFPPKIAPANVAYGKLPALEFPHSTVVGDFTYTIDTLDGTLPQFPDRLIVYPMAVPNPNLLSLDKVKEKIAAMDLTDSTGNPPAEIPLGGTSYEWRETSDVQRKVKFDIVSMNFTMDSEYLRSNTVLRANGLRNINDPVVTVPMIQGFLESIELFSDDIDLEKSSQPAPELKYLTKPQPYSISSGDLVPATSISNAQIIRVDLYQKNIAYKLTAGKGGNLTKFEDFKMDLPIMYPKPPYSTMNFLLGSGNSQLDVVSAVFEHQTVNLKPEKEATYPIKSAAEAFDELQQGNGYVASYGGGDNEILVSDVFLAYFLGDKQEEYLMPVIVFEGQNGFFAYVSAVKDELTE